MAALLSTSKEVQAAKGRDRYGEHGRECPLMKVKWRSAWKHRSNNDLHHLVFSPSWCPLIYVYVCICQPKQDVMILVDHFSVSDLNLASPADLACIQALAQVHPKVGAWRIHVLCIRVMCVCVLCFGVLCILVVCICVLCIFMLGIHMMCVCVM